MWLSARMNSTDEGLTLFEGEHAIGGKVEYVFPMSTKEFHERWNRWMQGEMVQSAFDNLSTEDRELLISGFTPEKWARVFGQPVEEPEEEDLSGVVSVSSEEISEVEEPSDVCPDDLIINAEDPMNEQKFKDAQNLGEII